MNSLNGSLRDTKSVSTPTSTSTPILPPPWMYESTRLLWSPGSSSSARGEALLAQLVQRLLEVAAGGGQRVLAVHHAGPALLAELLYQCSGDLSHSTISFSGSAVVVVRVVLGRLLVGLVLGGFGGLRLGLRRRLRLRPSARPSWRPASRRPRPWQPASSALRLGLLGGRLLGGLGLGGRLRRLGLGSGFLAPPACSAAAPPWRPRLRGRPWARLLAAGFSAAAALAAGLAGGRGLGARRCSATVGLAAARPLGRLAAALRPPRRRRGLCRGLRRRPSRRRRRPQRGRRFGALRSASAFISASVSSWRPSATASAITRTISEQQRMASSLPGMM